MKQIFKYGFYCLVIFIAYKALSYYSFYSFAIHSGECGVSKMAMEDLKKRQAPSWEVEKFLHDKYSCVKEKQTPIDKFFHPIPENWINPPPGSVTYEDIFKHQRK